MNANGRECCLVGTARCAVRAAYQRRNVGCYAYVRHMEFVPPALRAGTSQRDVPTFFIRVHSCSFVVSIESLRGGLAGWRRKPNLAGRKWWAL